MKTAKIYNFILIYVLKMIINLAMNHFTIHMNVNKNSNFYFTLFDKYNLYLSTYHRQITWIDFIPCPCKSTVKTFCYFATNEK